MILNGRQLIGLKVVTQSRRVLGQIKDFEIEAMSGKIIKYLISPSQLVQKILSQDLVISQDQVVEINEKEMVVADGLVSDPASAKEFAV